MDEKVRACIECVHCTRKRNCRLIRDSVEGTPLPCRLIRNSDNNACGPTGALFSEKFGALGVCTSHELSSGGLNIYVNCLYESGDTEALIELLRQDRRVGKLTESVLGKLSYYPNMLVRMAVLGHCNVTKDILNTRLKEDKIEQVRQRAESLLELHDLLNEVINNKEKE